MIAQSDTTMSQVIQADATSPSCFAKLANRLQVLRRRSHAPKRIFARPAQPSRERLDASLTDAPLDTEKLALLDGVAQEKQKTVLYLAYGSNLCNETFRGVRGIRPLSQVNVLVPSLRLTFDLPGIPYSEPCFANTALRVPAALDQHQEQLRRQDYHKDRWHKGLVGVVYEVTLSDYAHIIATEGGGSAYHDILVDCYVLPKADVVPSVPDSMPFKAHTLFAPVQNDEGDSQQTDRATRPDPSYAQPSARYLKLITDGATECDLPAEYQDYLHDIRTYTITSRKQAAGKALFLSIWMPFVLMVFTLSRKLQDKKGRAPGWLGQLSAMLFVGMWLSYDHLFKKTFGDGERTVGDEAMRGAKIKSKERPDQQSLLEATEDDDMLEQETRDTRNWRKFGGIV
ncbi:hypothetical protein N0V83_005026 [Neocucurbitaria cava]|uniref:gamma-glutamylcyclotransferase n=1 Tax=Neocucurbitaria cava TaxID=798079 RepID=A0A9W8Y8U1_9PLEO|nr:hypothetical protein N0V83_005026 [Neocucurbitaria cava]